VVEGEPSDDDRFRRLSEGATDHLLVRQQLRVAHHHAAGRRRRAGRVLQKGAGRTVDRRRLPIAGPDIVGGLGRQPLGAAQLGEVIHELPRPPEDLARGEHERGTGIAHDAAQSRLLAVAAGRIGGDGDRSGVKATEERGNEIQTWRVKQERSFPAGAMPLQPGRDGAGAAIELGVGQPRLFELAVRQEEKSAAVGVPAGPLTKRRDQGEIGWGAPRPLLRIQRHHGCRAEWPLAVMSPSGPGNSCLTDPPVLCSVCNRAYPFPRGHGAKSLACSRPNKVQPFYVLLRARMWTSGPFDLANHFRPSIFEPRSNFRERTVAAAVSARS
jgi:hypothetical protein